MKAVAAGAGRVIRHMLVAALAGVVLAMALAAVLAWRLSQGPLDLGWAARRIEQEANAPDSPSRLAIGAASIEWQGFATGAGGGLQLRLRNVQVVNRDTGRVASAGRLEISVSMRRLLIGQVVPVAITASGLNLHLLRGADRTVALDFGGIALGGDPGTPAPDLAASLAQLAQPSPPVEETPAPTGLQHLEQLRRVQLSDTVLTLEDAVLRTSSRLAISALDLRRQPGGGLRGTAAAVLQVGDARGTLALQAELAPGGGTQLQVQVAPIAATAMQQAATEQGVDPMPYLLDAAIQANGTMRLSPALHPTDATLHAEAGSGHVRIADGTIGFNTIQVDATAHWSQPGWTEPSNLALTRVHAVIRAPGGAWPSTLDASGTVERQGRQFVGQVSATLDHLAFADIAGLWPKRLGGHVRPWLTDNITAGTARDGAIKLSFAAADDFRTIALTAVDGSVAGDDVSIWWVRPVPPVEHVQAVLTIKDPQILDITVPSGRQGPLVMSNGRVHITGLQDEDQYMTLDADAAGQAADLIGLLRHPRLQLLDRKPIPMRNPSGTFAGHLTIDLPLKETLQFEQVHLGTQAHFTNLHLGGTVAGRDIDRGDVQLDASSEALRVVGTGAISGLPSSITVEMDFRNGGPKQVVQRAQAVTRADTRQLAAAGLDPSGVMPGGAGQFTAKYSQFRDGTGELGVAADLRDAQLALAGWKKLPGAPASGTARLLLRGDRLQGIDQLHAEAPGMSLDGHAELVGTSPLLLVLDRIMLDRTQASGQVRLPAMKGEPIRAKLAGPVLDLSAQLAAPTPDTPPPPDTPWIADVQFDRVLLSSDRGLAGVTAHAENDGIRLSALRASNTGPERLDATIAKQGTRRAVSVRAADGGALLRAFDLLDNVEGGKLTLDAAYDDSKAGSPLAGTAEMAGFHVSKAQLLGKLLQAATIYGVVDALSGPGLSFSDLVMPFRWDGKVLDVQDARAFSASLGLTAKGQIDKRRSSIDLQGTVIPAYVLNSMLGRIPLLGRLFSAEQGGGLVAVNYSLRGPVGNPAMTVNPLSALTPGFLRGLFHIFN